MSHECSIKTLQKFGWSPGVLKMCIPCVPLHHQQDVACCTCGRSLWLWARRSLIWQPDSSYCRRGRCVRAPADPSGWRSGHSPRTARCDSRRPFRERPADSMVPPARRRGICAGAPGTRWTGTERHGHASAAFFFEFFSLYMTVERMQYKCGEGMCQQPAHRVCIFLRYLTVWERIVCERQNQLLPY